MTETPLILALDQGGHASRAVVFDDCGEIVVQETVEVSVRVSDLRVEQDPVEVVASLRLAVERVAEALGDRVEHIGRAGLATQRSSLVAWEPVGTPLTPILSWQDRRAAAWLSRFDAHRDRVREITGLFLSPHYGASKIRWCLDHVEAVGHAHEENRLHCGPLASYLAFALLEEQPFVVDPANASRTLLFDVHTLDYSDELLSLFAVPRSVLPPCVETVSAFGTLRVGAREVPLRVLTGDQSAALLAQGVPDPATLCINLGTGAFVQRVATARSPFHDRLLDGVVYSEGDTTVRVLEGAINGAGAALTWLTQEHGVATEPAQLERALATVESPPLFLNGISGLGSPWWVADYPSRFVGEANADAADATNDDDKIAAVLESVAFLIAANHDAMESGLPPAERVRVTGGLSRLDGLCQRIADLLALPVDRSRQVEATARGVDWLLRRKVTAEIDVDRFEPEKNDGLRERYREWREWMDRDS